MNMITKQAILEITAEMRKNDPEYDLLCCQRRPEQNHRIFVINDNIYFEYWNVHEFEFTIYGEADGKERDDYYDLAWSMTLYASKIRLLPKQLPSFIATCKQRAASISKRYAA